MTPVVAPSQLVAPVVCVENFNGMTGMTPRKCISVIYNILNILNMLSNSCQTQLSTNPPVQGFSKAPSFSSPLGRWPQNSCEFFILSWFLAARLRRFRCGRSGRSGRSLDGLLSPRPSTGCGSRSRPPCAWLWPPREQRAAPGPWGTPPRASRTPAPWTAWTWTAPWTAGDAD